MDVSHTTELPSSAAALLAQGAGKFCFSRPRLYVISSGFDRLLKKIAQLFQPC